MLGQEEEPTNNDMACVGKIGATLANVRSVLGWVGRSGGNDPWTRRAGDWESETKYETDLATVGEGRERVKFNTGFHS